MLLKMRMALLQSGRSILGETLRVSLVLPLGVLNHTQATLLGITYVVFDDASEAKYELCEKFAGSKSLRLRFA